MSNFRISDFGMGSLFGCAVSIVASTQEPSSNKSANIRNCPTVRPRSPLARPSGNPVSEQYVFMSCTSNAKISSAIAFKNVAFFAPDIFL